MLEDAAEVERCRDGDTVAFGRLVTKYQDRVFNTCWRMCGDRTEAEDLTQEAFIRAWRALGGFDGRAKFYTWVFRIAVNLVISARRKHGRATIYSLDAGEAGATEGAPTSPAARLAADGQSPEEQASSRELQAAVLRGLEGLDEEHRTVVVLRDLESFAYDEIAEILGIAPGTVKSRLHRARLALREKLRPLLGST